MSNNTITTANPLQTAHTFSPSSLLPLTSPPSTSSPSSPSTSPPSTSPPSTSSPSSPLPPSSPSPTPPPSSESPLIWIHGPGPASRGSILTILAQNGYTREVHQILPLSRTASLIGRDSDGGLPQLWDIMGTKHYRLGITRLMALCIIRGPVSLNRARALIRDHNVNVMATDGCRSALHFALSNSFKILGGLTQLKDDKIYKCKRPIDIEFVRLLLESNPEIINSGYNHSPLHWACYNNASFEIIKLLVDACPNSVKRKTVGGKIALHYSCVANAPIQVIQYLLEVYPEGAKIGMTRIKHTETIGYPLHFACDGNASLEVITLLVKTYPDALRALDGRYGFIPLHYSCSKNAPLNVIKCLIDAFPDGVKTSTYQGLGLLLPLHIACRSKSSIEIIKLLITLYPEGLKQRSTFDRKLPLHLACESEAPTDVIRLVYENYKEAALETDTFSKIPAQYLGFKSLSFSVLPPLPKYTPNFSAWEKTRR
jgi:ankyrin repeat protein